MPEENPFSFNKPVYGSDFVGRHEQIKAIADELLYGSQSLLITGGRRFGRSSMLAELQHFLVQRLPRSIDKSEKYVFPIMVNLRSMDVSQQPTGSADLVKLLMLQQLHSFFTSPLLHETLHMLPMFDISQTKLHHFIQNLETHCSLYIFKNILEDLITFFLNTYGSLRLVFLLDETDKLLNKDWTATIFDHWGTILSTEPLSSYIRFVLIGSTQIIEVHEQGSALLISLKLEPLRAVSREALQQIIERMGNISNELADAIQEQCAGHPYLTTRILNSIWSNQQPNIPVSVDALIAEFYQQTLGGSDFKQWQKDLGKQALAIYQILIEHPTGLTRKDLARYSSPSHLTSALERLLHHGLISEDKETEQYCVTGKLFQNWFTTEALLQQVTQHVPSERNSPQIKMSPYTFLYPTSYAYGLEHDNGTRYFPMIRCEIENTNAQAKQMSLTITATLSNLSANDIRQIEIGPGQKIGVDLLPRPDLHHLQELQEISHRICQVTIQQDAPLGRNIYNQPHTLQLQAYNVVHLARLNAQNQLQEDLADYLSIFVTPNRPEISQWVGIAVSNYIGNEGFTGYDPTFWQHSAPDPRGARDAVRKQAKAIFKMLKYNAKLHYVNSTFYEELDTEQQQRFVTQRLRLPFESLANATGQANCLDGSLLFASLLLKVNIEPLIVLVKDHAFVGWRSATVSLIQYAGLKPENCCDFLETTMIHTHTFEQALNEGNQQYLIAMKQNMDQHPFWSKNGFLRVVDVRSCRIRQIIPLM